MTMLQIFYRVFLFTTLLCVSALSASRAMAQSDEEGYVTLPVNVSLVPGVSVGDAVSNATGKKIVNNVALSVLAGRAARLQGVEWAGLASLYSEKVHGAQFSGLANLVGGGAEAAQFAGLLNIVSGDARIAQFGGVLNIAGEGALGAQFAGAVNLVSEEFDGAQFSGGVNLVGEDLRGAQFAGLANVVAGTSSGLQMAPVNIACDVTGVQIGVVNSAETNEGVPIGLVSYVRDVGLQFDVWADETGMFSGSVRTGNERFSNHLGFGIAPLGERTYLGLLAGLGVEVPIVEDVVRFGFDLIGYGLYNDDLENNWLQLSKARALVGVTLVDRLELFGGPTFNVLVADEADRDVNLTPWSVYEYTSSDVHVRLWPGFVTGLRLTN